MTHDNDNLTKAGLPRQRRYNGRRKCTRQRWSNEVVLQVITMYNSGMTPNEITKETGVPSGTMNGWFHRTGIKPMHRPGDDRTDQDPVVEMPVEPVQEELQLVPPTVAVSGDNSDALQMIAEELHNINANLTQIAANTRILTLSGKENPLWSPLWQINHRLNDHNAALGVPNSLKVVQRQESQAQGEL